MKSITKHVFLLVAFLHSSTAIFSQNSTLNANALANILFTDVEVTYKYIPVSNQADIRVLKIKTGIKDMAGNDEVYFRLIDDQLKDTFYFLPDNHVYPLSFWFFDPSREPVIGDDGFRYGFDYNMWPYVLIASKQATFMNRNDSFFKDFKKLRPDEDYYYSLKDQTDFLKAELVNLWKQIDAYYSSKIEALKGKKYDDLMAKMDGKKIYICRRNKDIYTAEATFDIPKISFTKDENGKLKELILNYPFIDGKYYDKPDFKKVITKDQTGLFYFTTANNTLTGFLDGYFVPFNDGFLIVDAPTINTYNNGTSECDISAGASPNIWDIENFNIIREKSVYNQSIGLFGSEAIEQFYMDWWKTSNVSMSYESAKDKRNIDLWLPEYFAAVLETAK